MLKGYISSFKNLSTVTFVHRLESDREPVDWTNPAWSREFEPIWREVTDLVTSQLGGSTVGGPKMMKVLTVYGGNSSGPMVIAKEYIVRQGILVQVR